MLKAFNLLEIFWDYDIIVTIDMPSLGYFPVLGLYSAGKSTVLFCHILNFSVWEFVIIKVTLSRIFPVFTFLFTLLKKDKDKEN